MTDRPWDSGGEMEATVIWPEPGRVELLVGDAVITLTPQQADDLGRLLGTAADQAEPVCGFCKGKPVGDAATWVDGKPRPPAPCPRCGAVG